MRHVGRLMSWLVLGVMAIAPAAAARELQVVVNRTPQAIELYIAGPAEDLLESFGLPQSSVLTDAGTVDYDRFRYGSYEEGDALFASVTADAGGRALTFEAMSLTFHPTSAAPLFQTPYDAMLAIAICTTPDLGADLTLDASKVHAGYIAYTDRPDAAVSLTWPRSGRAPHHVIVRDYDGARLRATYQTVVPDGAPLSVAALPARPTWTVPSVFLAVAALINLGALWVGRRANQRLVVPI